MAHFAKINSENIVEQVIVIDNKDIQNLEFPESEIIGQTFIKNLGLDGKWLQTSYNNNYRNVYAGQGFSYDVQSDNFYPPKPKLSDYPGATGYYWDPELQVWVPVFKE
jgi:hypothetical protein